MSSPFMPVASILSSSARWATGGIRGSVYGSILGVIKGDASGLDCSSYGISQVYGPLPHNQPHAYKIQAFPNILGPLTSTRP